MRTAYNETKIILNDDDFCGINLGWDFTSEHEWGIKNLEKSFGIPIKKDKYYSLEAYKITTVPKEFQFFTINKEAYLIYCTSYKNPNNNYKYIKQFLPGHYNRDDLYCGWDDGSFGIKATKEDDIKYLKTLYEEINNKNVIIKIGGSNGIGNGGLVIYIYSKITKKQHQEYKDSKIDYMNLLAEDKKIGIKEKLKEAGKEYFALSPRWSTNDYQTEYKVIYWLNPFHQNLYNSRWSTVEDLLQWIDGKGPILKLKDIK